MISGIRTHVPSNVIMANMASLLTMIDIRFIFSHDISYIFVKSIQHYFEEKDAQFRVQIDKSDKNKRRKWSDLFYNDVIHRPKELSNLCVYEISMWFERIAITRRRMIEMNQKEQDDDLKVYNSIEEIRTDDIFYFRPENSGHKHICLKNMNSCKIPKVYRSCDINISNLCMDDDEVNGTLNLLQEQYAQEDLILFLPYQKDSDLRPSFDKMHWTSFTRY